MELFRVAVRETFQTFKMGILAILQMVLWLISGRFRLFLKRMRKFLREFNNALEAFSGHKVTNEIPSWTAKQLKALEEKVRGLHKLLPYPEQFSYSILVVAAEFEVESLRNTIESILCQSPQKFEILVGFDATKIHELRKACEGVSNLRKSDCGAPVIREISFDLGELESREKARLVANGLAKEARSLYLLYIESGWWIRPDMIYIFEQTLRLDRNNSHAVVLCEEDAKLEKKGSLENQVSLHYPSLLFPYEFESRESECFLVSRKNWHLVGGIGEGLGTYGILNFFQKLDTKNVSFSRVPFPLLKRPKSLDDKNWVESEKDRSTIITGFSNYVSSRGLKWDVSFGIRPGTFRAKPILSSKSAMKVHVILLYRDRRKMTLTAVQSVLKQSGVSTAITAIDNLSDDLNIGKDLQNLGVEVIRIEEPFNYSRLNNFGVKLSKYSSDESPILFLNNDVELQSTAINEMLRWIDQPQIGIVGARLQYDSDTVQHGGARCEIGPMGQMHWHHTDAGVSLKDAKLARTIHISEAVTGACLLMRRDLFSKLGGFDELFYPIAFSDTDLCLRAKKAGYLSLYTPFAMGYHYESKSRGKINIEDFESSVWLSNRTAKFTRIFEETDSITTELRPEV